MLKKFAVVLFIPAFVLILSACAAYVYVPDMPLILPCIAQERIDRRANAVVYALHSPPSGIVPAGETKVSRTGIEFSLHNQSGRDFFYSTDWDLAHYVSGEWRFVPHRPELGIIAVGTPLLNLQDGGIKQYRMDLAHRFGELQTGRYMYIRWGRFDEYNTRRDYVYALVEFFVTEDTPKALPPPPERVQVSPFELVESGDVTPAGMRIVIENTSDYDANLQIYIESMISERYVVSENHWEWERRLLLDYLPEALGYVLQWEGFFQSGGQMELVLDWTNVFGELPPGGYRLVIVLHRQMHPPYPTRRVRLDALVIPVDVPGKQ